MNIINVDVPLDVEYISEWKEYYLPTGHLILDKGICGCGYTEYCLVNNYPTILCVPRKTLLKNKKKQHLEENNIYCFYNVYDKEEYDKDVADNEKDDKLLKAISNNDRKEYIFQLKANLSHWLYQIEKSNQIPKILVTYDSLKYVLEVIGKYRLDNFYTIVDEFQSIFMDSTFKPDTEIDFLDYLKDCKNVIYLSATPMLSNYLNELDYFSQLPVYKFNWDSSRIDSVCINRLFTKSVNNEIIRLINEYKAGNFPKRVLNNGETVYSKELIIFVNSVNSICNIIRATGLTEDETIIICADTTYNRSKLSKLNHSIGEPPLEGQEHKMFTFCTRTTYVGSDFYHPSGYTVIASDCNIKTLVVDINLDLPQILGRQRLKSNVFRDEVLLIYKSSSKKNSIINLTQEEFDSRMEEMERETKLLLEEAEKMSDEGRNSWAVKAARDKRLYETDFVGVSKKTGKLQYNFLVRVANQRAFDISRKEYQDHVAIKRGIESLGHSVVDVDIKSNITEESTIVNEFLNLYEECAFFDNRLKLLCEYSIKFPEILSNPMIKSCVSKEYFNYINLLGVEKLKSLCYVKGNIDKYIESEKILKDSSDLIYELFLEGQKYTLTEIKEKLTIFYNENNIKRMAKASDIVKYFEVRTCRLENNTTGKRDSGYTILKRK